MIEYNNNMLKGATIINVRKMTEEECNAHLWDNHHPVYILELDNGIALYPSRDFEGNGGGVFFGVNKDQEYFDVFEKMELI